MGDQSNVAPTTEEFFWAHHINRRHFELVENRKIQALPMFGGAVDFPPYTAEEQAFLAECEAGMLAKAHDILDQRERAMGRKPWREMTEEERDVERQRLKREAEEALGQLHENIERGSGL